VQDDTSTPVSPVPRWTASAASDAAYELAEGPLWDAPRQRLLWVDILAGTVHEGRLEGGRVIPAASRALDGTVSAVVSSAAGDLLVAGAGALTVVTPGGDLLPGPRILAPSSPSRLNDGKCDPAGAFLVGSMATDDARGQEVLVRVGRDGAISVLDDDLTLSNGLAWSPDGSLLYSIDSVPGVVWVRSYDAASGATGPRSALLRITDGLPDGMCADTDGYLWIAVWGAGQVRRFAADGTPAGVIDVPSPHVTSIAFAGDDPGLVVITSATEDLTPSQRAGWPDAGRLFTARVDAAGLPVTPWASPG
jgi:sugar lactone lactonase YvrE